MQKITMLSVDEKTFTSELDRAGYRKMGIHVHSASRSEDLVSLLNRVPIDIVVINMDHTKIDAIHALQAVKNDRRWNEIPVVLTSVQSCPKLRKLALTSGADLFVEQPLPRDYFIEKIKSMLSHETRSKQRITGSMTVDFVWDGQKGTSAVKDISLSGILISSPRLIPIGESISVEINLGASTKPILVTCEVVRHIQSHEKLKGDTAEQAIGLRFNQFRAEGKQRIESWIARNSDMGKKMAYYL